MNKRIVLTLGLLIGQLFGTQCPDEMLSIQTKYRPKTSFGFGGIEVVRRGSNSAPMMTPEDACSSYQKNCWPYLRKNLNYLLNTTSPDVASDALNNLAYYYKDYDIDQNSSDFVDRLTRLLNNELIPVAMTCPSIKNYMDSVTNLTTGTPPLISLPTPSSDVVFGDGGLTEIYINSTVLKNRINFAKSK